MYVVLHQTKNENLPFQNGIFNLFNDEIRLCVCPFLKKKYHTDVKCELDIFVFFAWQASAPHVQLIV